jgi:hypothetical protein
VPIFPVAFSIREMLAKRKLLFLLLNYQKWRTVTLDLLIAMCYITAIANSYGCLYKKTELKYPWQRRSEATHVRNHF